MPNIVVMFRPQNLVEHIHALGKLADRELRDHLAVIHHIEAIGDAAGEAEILLDEQDGHATAFQLLQDFADALNDDRGKALGRFVKQQHTDAGAQDAGHGKHLLFAAGKPCTDAIAPLMQVGEQLEDLVESHTTSGDDRRQHQVFIDAKRREDAALFRHEADTLMRRLVQRHLHHVLAGKGDPALAGADDADDGAQCRRLADAVAAENGNGFPLTHAHIDAMQDVTFTIPALSP